MKRYGITVGDNIKLNVRLVDCVGYLVNNAIGYLEDDMPRMVKTPWSTEEITNIINSYKLEELEIETMYTLTEDERKDSEDYLTIMDNNITKFKTELFR